MDDTIVSELKDTVSEMETPLLKRIMEEEKKAAARNRTSNGGGKYNPPPQSEDFEDEDNNNTNDDEVDVDDNNNNIQETTSLLLVDDESCRILDRDGSYFQSLGHWGVARLSAKRLSWGQRLLRNRRNNGSSAGALRSLMKTLWADWFHSLAYRPTLQLMGILFFAYALAVFVFAYIYLGVSTLGLMLIKRSDPEDTSTSFCGMDITNHMEALYFSLSTMTTIGYGVSDYYFGDCWTPLLLVLWQSCWAITFQSIAIGLLFQRISRGTKRSKTIVFSDKAVIRYVKGIPHFMFRVGELRKHNLIEVSVRCYCLKHERYLKKNTNNNNNNRRKEVETAHFVTRHLKLLYPDETLGSHILMSLPQVIVHRINEDSPLVPSQDVWYDRLGHQHYTRQESSLLDEAYICDREIEIIVQVEGTDELTGQTLQARHSYRCNDLAWNSTFAPCVEPSKQEDSNCNTRNLLRCCNKRNSKDNVLLCNVDFSKFHDTIPTEDTDECPYVSM